MNIGRNGLGGSEDRADLGENRIRYKRLSENPKFAYIVVAILSAIVFCSIYGVKVLNPAYVDWLLAGGDLTQHYLGWTAYRIGAWHVPIGMTDILAYPNQTSIIFTDSIPLFAVLFKMLSPILPEKFQYFGIWGILCFILQGVLAARIFKNFLEDKLVIVIISLFYVFTPVMIWRMYGHTALAGQWILLLGLEMLFAPWKYKSSKRAYLIVGLMGVLSVSIHMYFVLMSGIILLGICFTDVFVYRRIKRSGLILTEYLTLVAIVTWLLGGFGSGMEAEGLGLGLYSSNLNTFFNPMGWSRIYRELPLRDWQYEGFGYLGGGCIVLALSTIICLADHNMQICLKRHWKESVTVVLVSCVSMIVALSPVITMNDQVILQMQLPQWLADKWSVFRSSGRVVWNVIYIMMLCSCIVILKTVNKRMTLAVLSVALMIQVYDISDVLKTKYENFSSTQKYVSMLTEDDFWDCIAQNDDIRHVVYFSTVEQPMMYSITNWAMQNRKTVNNFYFARLIDDKVSDSTKDAFNTLSNDTLFIFNKEECLSTLQYDLHYYQIDGLIVGCVDRISDFEEMLDSDVALNWNFKDNLYLSENGGLDTENGREIYPGGLSFGPYWSVPKGKYMITIQGEQMQSGLEVFIYSQHGGLWHDFETLSRSSSEIKISISLSENVEDLEICIKNNTDSTGLLKGMEIRYAE